MMNKRKFLKTIISLLGIVYLSPVFTKKRNLEKKVIKKRKYSKIWFLHIDDFK